MISALTDWITSDGPATWLSLVVSVGAGSFVGASAAARERMRLEDRRLLYDRHLPAVSTVAAEIDRAKLDEDLSAYTFLDIDNTEPLVKSALLAVRGVEAAERVIPLLSWTERTMWRIAKTDLNLASEQQTAFGFLSMRVQGHEALPSGFASDTDRRTFPEEDSIDLQPFQHPYAEAFTEFGGIPSVERLIGLLAAKLNPRLTNLWLRRTAPIQAVGRAVITRFRQRDSAEARAEQWEHSLKWTDSG